MDFTLLIYEAQWTSSGFISQHPYNFSHIPNWRLPPGKVKAAEDIRNEAKSVKWSKASHTQGREYPGVMVMRSSI